MFASERQEEIAQLVSERSAVRINELVSRFGVSAETIRRDLLELERVHRLRRVHGGALRIPCSVEYLSRSERGGKNQARKAELAEYAAGLIRENDTIMVDSGSTAVEFARMLVRRFEKLTVITNSLEVFELVRARESYSLYLCSGFFLPGENAFYGPWTLDFLGQLHAATAFLFPSAISMQYGAMDYDRDLYGVQQKMMERADRTVFLADSDKFEKTALLKLADLREDSLLVTDSGLEEEIFQLYQENRIRVMRGEKSGNKFPND